MDQNATGNVLDNASIPPGQTAAVAGFSVAGSSQLICPLPMPLRRSLQSMTGPISPDCVKSGPVTLTDPKTGEIIGTMAIAADGSYVFDPVPAYVGPVPSVNVYTATSGGQTAISTLTIDVAAGMAYQEVMSPGHTLPYQSALKRPCWACVPRAADLTGSWLRHTCADR
jgi:hypothetical protein